MDERKKIFFILSVIIFIFLTLVFLQSFQKDKRLAQIDIREETGLPDSAGALIDVESEESEGKTESLLDRLKRKQGSFSQDGPAADEKEIEDKAKNILEKLQNRQKELSKEEPLSVRAFKVKKVRYEDDLPVTGDIKSTKEIKLRFEKEGLIEEIKVREGDIVKKDDLIASLYKKDSQLAVARAQSKFDSDNAAALAAGKELELTELLYEKGAIVESKLEEVRFRVESERGKVRVSEEELKMAKSALEKTELRAPIDGVIGAREAEEGEFFTPRDIVANLLCTKDIYVEVGIVERDIHKVSIGYKADVHVDAYPDRKFEGKIGNLYPVVEGRSRTMKAEVNIVDKEGVILPGMFAQINIFLAKFDSAYMVPTMAIMRVTPDVLVVPVIISEEGMDEELMAKGEGTGIIKLQEVRVGYVGPDYTQIISGVREKDIIVLEAHGIIEDGRRVRILGVEEYGVNE